MKTAQKLPACPSCEANQVILIGSTVCFGQFGGGALVCDMSGNFASYQCRACRLVFKFPRIEETASNELYNQSDGSVWNSSVPRPEFGIARRLIEALPVSQPAVLDVGCNRGEFLASLPATVGRFGVEVNARAGLHAQRAGAVVWRSLEQVPPDQFFNAITCFDVIEHIADPASFLHALTERLCPGGVCIVSSGDAAVFLTQKNPSQNWYFSNPEHISFISLEWIKATVARMPDVALEATQPFLHGSPLTGWIPRAKIFLFKTWPAGYLRLYSLLKKVLRLNTGLFVPGNGYSVDHVCFVLRRRHAAQP